MSDTTRLGLPLIQAAQAQKHVTHNEALRILDTLIQAVALDRTRATPPTTPAEGEIHVVATSPTGGWSGHAGHLAVRQDGVWVFVVPQLGWTVWLADESLPITWTGSAWKPTHQVIGALGGLTGVGIGATPDATNRLSVKAPAALFAAELAAAGGSGDFRLTVEKENAADTASLLFQTGFSGRAEIGLTGDDDLRLKVSPDGSTWTDALQIVAATGQLVLGGGLAGGGRLKSTSWFLASGTWTRPAGVRLALVFAQGAGGGGGGCSGAASSGAAGGGGGAGGLAVSLIDVTAIASRTVTVGAAGTAGANTGGTGGTGGSTSFGTEVVAAGGVGGTGMTAGTTVTTAAGGSGGGTSAGDAGFTGAPGAVALRLDGTNIVAGNGAPSFFGGGGRGANTNANGNAGTARGSGGSGAAVSASATARAGGAGAAGLVWVWEFE